MRNPSGTYDVRKEPATAASSSMPGWFPDAYFVSHSATTCRLVAGSQMGSLTPYRINFVAAFKYANSMLHMT